LHGTGGGIGGIPPLAAYFANAIASGSIPPLLVVFPNGLAESMWTNAKDGQVPMETVVVRDLVDHVDTVFRTHARREGRILEGFSMGGMGAGRLGFRHHARFGAVSMLGAGPLDPDFMGPRAQANPTERARIFQNVWGSDLAYYRSESPTGLATLHQSVLRQTPQAGGVRIRIALGTQDFALPDNRVFHEHLTALGIAHDFILVPGVGHQALPLLNALGEAGWLFYRNALSGLEG
jgi:S-formylglutathione hydrolase FrmB